MSKRAWLLLVVALLAAGAFWFASRRSGPRARLIVLITPDTLRRDHVGAYGIGKFTPHMDTWAQSAIRFDQARSPVPLTLPAHVTMLAGLPPARTGVRTNAERVAPRAARSYALLPEVLSAQDWHTAGFVSASVMGRATGLGDAFDHFDDGDLRDQGTLSVPERPHTQTVARALAHLRSRARDEPVFLWVHLFEPHAPYAETGRYAGGVRAVDEGIRDLLQGIARIRGDDVCVLIAADHGEALGDLGEPSHAVLLGDAVLRVPFFLRAPDAAAAVRADPAELADVAPTLAEAAGVAWPHAQGPGVGRSLWTPGPARPSLSESLEGHRRYRWAQLVGASTPDGTLVDVGEGRFHWFPQSAPGQDQSGPLPPPDDPATHALADMIATYKQIDSPAALPGTAPRYYTRSGSAGPLVAGSENATLPDPYHVIGRAQVIAGITQAIRSKVQSPRSIDAALRELARLAAVDGNNPEIAFWQGMAWERAMRLFATRRPDDVASAAEHAAASYLRAFDLGRVDPTTVWKAVGINPAVPPDELLVRLDRLRKQLPAPDCRVLLLRARLLQAIPGRVAEAHAACQEAAEHCRKAQKMDVWSRTCGN